MAPKFRVAISGGGIGGLAAAAFICQNSDNIEVDLYETKPEISVIGAGIAIWKRTWDVLVDLGLQAEVEKRNLPLPKEGEVRGPIFRKGDEPNGGYDFHNHMMPYGPLTVQRPVFLDMLQARLTDKCKLHTSKNVASYEETDSGIVIKFSDGSTSTTDILIGADGVHSNTRASLFKKLASETSDEAQARRLEKYGEPMFSGTVCYRTTVPIAKVKAERPDHQAITLPKIWCGKDKHIVTHPFGEIINFVCFYNIPGGEGTVFKDAWVQDVEAKEVVERYEGWDPDLTYLLGFFEKVNRWAIHVVDPLPQFVKGNVALLGDAAHAMTPHQGVGGGQAVEDAYILGRLLGHEKTTLANVAQVLEIYQKVRLPLAQQTAEKSRKNGWLYDFVHPDFDIGPSSTKEDLAKVGKAVGESFAWLAKGGPYDEWAQAESLLQALP